MAHRHRVKREHPRLVGSSRTQRRSNTKAIIRRACQRATGAAVRHGRAAPPRRDG